MLLPLRSGCRRLARSSQQAATLRLCGRRGCTNSTEQQDGGSQKPRKIDEGADEHSGEKPDPLEFAKTTWAMGVQGKIAAKHRPPQPGLLKTWIGKKMVSRHLKLAAAEHGDFDNIEENLMEGAPLCLRFLADDALDGDKFTGNAASSLQGSLMDEVFSERLCEMMTSLRSAGCTWSWKLEEIEDVSLRRMFIIVGASRGGTVHRGPTGILGAFGQQFVLTKDQTQRFLDKSSGMQGRMSVLQELLVSDSVLVGDVVLRARQRSYLHCDAGSNQQAAELGSRETVEHVLRLEMHLGQDRGDELPMLRPASWQIADWNWLCLGNHPALPPGVAAPW